MKPTDWIGALGVSILLLAFFLNVANRLHKDSYAYILMNVTGAGIACLASVMIDYIPFVILEGCWTLVSLGALLKQIRRT